MTPCPRQIVPLCEWETRVLPGLRLGRADQALAARLAAEQRLHLVELRDGVRITGTSWVGVVVFDALELHIEPKLAGDRLDLLAMIAFTHGLDALHRMEGTLQLRAKDEHLFDLLARLLADACRRLLRSGLMTDYTEREELLSCVRGRLDVEELAVRRFGRADLVPCRFDDRLQDVLENQILALALGTCQRLVSSPGVRQQLAGVLPAFDEICDAGAIDLSRGVPAVTYHRLNEHYREAHQLARLVLEGSALQAMDRQGSVASHAFLLDMNVLFEDFVVRLYESLARGTTTRVRAQAHSASIILRVPDDRPYRSVIPDLLVERPHPQPDVLPVDAKYKTYDLMKVSTGDIYQVFLYAYAHSRRPLPTALLVHPSSTGELKQVRLRVRSVNGLPGGEIGVVSIPVRETLAALRPGASAGAKALEAELKSVLLGG